MEEDELKKLYDERSALEKEILEHRQVLIANGVGMHEPLVDEEDYPLEHINVYAVRIARANIIRLMNDCKDVTEKISSCVKQRFDSYTESPQPVPRVQSTPNYKKLARVEKIQKGSSAEYYGFKEGDIILEFGPINGSNFKGLPHFAEVVKNSQGLLIKVIVEREGAVKRLNLKATAGLGCLIVPIK